MQQSFLSINKLSEKPYVTIVGYPNATKKQVQLRIAQMKKLGINSVSFQGDLKLGSISILGKGYVGIVVLAKRQNKIVAVKIRRTDSQRKEMKNEAKLLEIANSSGVGPHLITSSKNFMVMEYLDGKKIGLWIRDLKGKGSSLRLKSVIKKTLEDCYNLDQIGLDHGELSTLSKHVIIGKNKVSLIDFESSSTNRQVSNVTSATQGIFIGSGIAKSIKKIYKIPQRRSIIKVLRNYKKGKTRKNFDSILDVLKLS
jgi:putative serine/threonine protein kinase